MLKAMAGAIVLSAGLVASGTSYGHHSASQFDFSQRVAVTGIVKSIDVRNPHLKLVLEVTDASGTAREIEYEGDGRNNLFRAGWRTDDIQVGDEVTVGVAPLEDGSEGGGYVRSFTLSNGKQF